MISIQEKSTGRYFDLFPKEKINLEIQNPFFFSEVRGSFVHTFKMPYTPPNIAILGAIGVMQSIAEHQNSVAVYIYIDDVFWFEGLLFAEKGKADLEFNVRISIDFGDFRNEIGNKTLREVITQTYNLPTTATDFRSFYQLFPAVPDAVYTYTYEIQKNGVKITGGFLKLLGTEVADKEVIFQASVDEINATQPTLRAYLQPSSNSFIITIFPTNLSTDSFQFVEVLQYLGGGAPDIITSSLSENTLYLPNLEDGDFQDFVFPEIYHQNFYDGGNENFLKILNYYEVSQGAYYRNGPFDTIFNKFAHSPQLRLNRVFFYIAQAAGYTVEGEFLDDADLAKLIIANTYATDQGLIVDADNSIDVLNVHSNIIKYANHLPDMSVNEFFEKFQNMFCAYFTFSIKEKIMNVKLRKNRLNLSASTASNLDGRVVIDYEDVILKKNILLKYSTNIDSKTELGSASAGTFAQTDIMPSEAGTFTSNATYYAIASNFDGNSEMFGLGTDNDFPLLFLFWHGFINDRPVATSKEMDGFPYSLRWDGAKGLYENLWKDYITFLLNTKQADAVCWLDMDTAKRMVDKIDEVLIYHDNLYYMVKSMQIQITDTNAPFSAGATAILVKYSK
jgi:hypothetical protein